MDRNTKKALVKAVLICLGFSALLHWKDVKNGFVDGLKDSATSVSK